MGWSVIILLSPYENQRLVPTNTSSTLSYLQVIEYPEINRYVELEWEALETTGHMGPKERRALTSPNTRCAYLSPTGADEKSLHRVALFNLTQLVELKTPRSSGRSGRPEPDSNNLSRTLMNHVQEQYFEGFLALRHSDIWEGTLLLFSLWGRVYILLFHTQKLESYFYSSWEETKKSCWNFPSIYWPTTQFVNWLHTAKDGLKNPI